jgi:hypothetical protein
MLLLAIHAACSVNVLGICIFKSIARIECPACGITHSVMAIYRGHTGEAFSIHPAGPVIVGFICIMTSYLLAILLAGYRGMEWSKEAKAYSILNGLMVSSLVAGWIGKVFIY